MTRVELCWGCQNVLGAVHVHARPATARLVGGGWQRWHPTCVPDGHETAEPRPPAGARCDGCTIHTNAGQWGGCCDTNDCGPCCEQCPTCPALARRRAEVSS